MTESHLDVHLQLVTDRRRRQAIQYLRHEANGKTTIDDLVDAMRTGVSRTDDKTTDRKQLAIQLYHAHLPKLADHGIVEFDPGKQAVRYRSNEQIERVLDSLRNEQSVVNP